MNQLTMGWRSSQLHSALKACWVTLSAGDSATAAHTNCINSSVLLDIQHLWIQLTPMSVITVRTTKQYTLVAATDSLETEESPLTTSRWEAVMKYEKIKVYQCCGVRPFIIVSQLVKYVFLMSKNKDGTILCESCPLMLLLKRTPCLRLNIKTNVKCLLMYEDMFRINIKLGDHTDSVSLSWMDSVIAMQTFFLSIRKKDHTFL